MLDKLILLRNILIERLPNVIMWSKVGIYFPGDRFPINTVTEQTTTPGHFYIIWHDKRREDNPHPYHSKEIPMTIDDLDAVIKRQREKLRYESKSS